MLGKTWKGEQRNRIQHFQFYHLYGWHGRTNILCFIALLRLTLINYNKKIYNNINVSLIRLLKRFNHSSENKKVEPNPRQKRMDLGSELFVNSWNIQMNGT